MTGNCTICGEEITVSRMATEFEEKGVEKQAHDHCLGQIDNSRRRKMKIKG